MLAIVFVLSTYATDESVRIFSTLTVVATGPKIQAKLFLHLLLAEAVTALTVCVTLTAASRLVGSTSHFTRPQGPDYRPTAGERGRERGGEGQRQR